MLNSTSIAYTAHVHTALHTVYILEQLSMGGLTLHVLSHEFDMPQLTVNKISRMSSFLLDLS